MAEATVYLAFPSKGALLDAVIVRATRDNASETLDAIAAAPPEEVLPRLASSNAVLMARAGRLIAIGESATLMDAELRPLRERAHRNLRAAFRRVADRLDAAGLLRVDAQDAADTLYAIAAESTYLRMTEGAGLSPDRYAGVARRHARRAPRGRARPLTGRAVGPARSTSGGAGRCRTQVPHRVSPTVNVRELVPFAARCSSRSRSSPSAAA